MIIRQKARLFGSSQAYSIQDRKEPSYTERCFGHTIIAGTPDEETTIMISQGTYKRNKLGEDGGKKNNQQPGII